MFYEERMIDGLLCYRSRPDAEWRPISTQELSRRAAQVAELVKALKFARVQLEEYELEASGGAYNDPDLNALIAAAEGGANGIH